jgi:RNA polymerase sigma factor (sigma-70 family)
VSPSRLPNPDVDTDTALLLRAKTDAPSLDRVVSLYKPFVRAMAERIAPPAARRRLYDADDLESYGLVALVAAVRAWDPEESSFATWLVKRLGYAFLDCVRDYMPLSRAAYEAGEAAPRH